MKKDIIEHGLNSELKSCIITKLQFFFLEGDIMHQRKYKKKHRKLTKKQWVIIGTSVIVISSLAGAGLWQVKKWNEGMPDEKTAAEKEIENINPRDNVVDESSVFKGELPSSEDKKMLKETEKKKGSSKQTESTETLENTENQGSTSQTEVSENLGETEQEQPGTPEQEQPEIPEQEQPQMPEVEEPGWTVGIY